MLFCSGLNQASTNLYSFEQGCIAAYRLYGVIRHSGSSADLDGNTLVSVKGKIEFRNIYFSYPSCPMSPILSGFYLTVPAKKTVALVGRSGSGKSSLIPLLERHYDPNLGKMIQFYECLELGSCLKTGFEGPCHEKKKKHSAYSKVTNTSSF